MPVCAIYARVSTDKQGESVSHQISLLRDYAKHQGNDWIVNDAYVYRDDGVSGTMITKRYAVQQMIQDAKSGLFDTVLFKGISRFARDIVDAVNMLRIFRSLNIRVISFEENYDSAKSEDDFLFTIHAAVAQQESAKIGLRTRLGHYELAKQGKWVKGRTPFGYGKDTVTKKLVVNEDEAHVVRVIYDMYTNRGIGSRGISHYLNERGLKPRSKKLWNGETVIKILKNEVYTGTLRYGDRVLKTDINIDNPSDRRKIKINNPRTEEIVVIKDAHDQIIDEDTFRKAQSIMRSRNNKRLKGEGYVLTGILVCPKCGNGMVSQSRKWMSNGEQKSILYYTCTTKFKYGLSACDQKNFRGDKIERMVIKYLHRVFASVSKEELRLRLQEGNGDSTPKSENKIRHIESKLADIKSQIVNANMKNAKGVIDDQTLTLILEELQSERDVLDRERIELVRQLSDKRDEHAIDSFAQAAQDVMSLKEVTPENRQFARVILHRLIEEISVQDRKLRIKLKFPTKTLLTNAH